MVATVAGSARQFFCPRCGAHVLICRRCDRGNLYCPSCAPQARRESCRGYERDYRKTLGGKLSNQRRQARARKRRREQRRAASDLVTHRGSQSSAPQREQTSSEAAPPVIGVSSEPSSEVNHDGSSTLPGQEASKPRVCAFCSLAVPQHSRRNSLLRAKARRRRSGNDPRPRRPP